LVVSVVAEIFAIPKLKTLPTATPASSATTAVDELHVCAIAAILHDIRSSEGQEELRAAAAPTSLHSPIATIELRMPVSLHSSKHQDDVALPLQIYVSAVSDVCFKCFI